MKHMNGGSINHGAECNGLDSCMDMVSNTDTSTYCYGEESCIGALFNEPAQITCGGYGACVDVTYGATDSGHFVCSGKDSCVGVTADGVISTKEFDCTGSSSCTRFRVESGNMII